jgi:hypothetical protein
LCIPQSWLSYADIALEEIVVPRHPTSQWDMKTILTSVFQLNLPEDAHDAATEAIEISRWLEGNNPFLPNADLVASLEKLSHYLSEVYRRAEALEVIQMAVEIRRELIMDHPTEFCPDLTLSLDTLSICLSEVLRLEEALEVIQEAVGINRELTAVHLTKFCPNLAQSLDIFSIGLLTVQC